MDEYDLIAKLRPLAGEGAFDLKDDAALLRPGAFGIVISTDTMVEGVHFPKGRRGGGFAERLLRTALSDLAAKAARPTGYMLNLSWPEGTEQHWIDGFVRGLYEAQTEFKCPLLGGDTTVIDGPLVASATVFGNAPATGMITRSGAQIGDNIYYSGVLGQAANGLKIVLGETVTLSPQAFNAAEEAYLRPVPRFDLIDILSNYATSACDISDGLLRDANHIAMASGRRLDFIKAHVPNPDMGDDYEILFTASPNVHSKIIRAAERQAVKLTLCGTVELGDGVSINGHPVKPTGYKHEL